jgi:hypothetical protein
VASEKAWKPKASAMSDWYAYQGPFIHFVRYGAYPSASKDAILIGIYKTFDEAEEAALLNSKAKTSEK